MKLLSVFLIIIGSICLLLSVLFKITHWSGVNLLIISGILVMISGILILTKHQKNE